MTEDDAVEEDFKYDSLMMKKNFTDVELAICDSQQLLSDWI
jgi:hypothetical protein